MNKSTIWIFICLITALLLAPQQMVLAGPDQKIYLPAVFNPPVPNPFWIQIAALHQIKPDASPADQEKDEQTWMDQVEDAFPTLVDALVESGAGGTRIYLQWSDIEPVAPVNGQPQYSAAKQAWYDARLRQIAEHKLDILVTVAMFPTWASASPCEPIYPDRLDEFSRFLTDLVNRYQNPPYHVKYWEILNEPDYMASNGWEMGLGCLGNKADQYVRILATAYTAIKTADPNAVVLLGGLAYDWFPESNNGLFNRYFSDEVMEAGGSAFLDALNFHYFPDFHPEWERWDANSQDRRNGWLPAPTCGDIYDGLGTTYEAGGVDLIAKTSHLVNRMRVCHGVNKPVWVTELAEHGYPGNPASLTQQVRYVIQGNVRGLAAGAKNIVWYALTTPNDPFEQSLLFEDWTPKPAFNAFKTMTRELKDYTYHHSLSVVDVEAYVFISSTHPQKIAAWGSGRLTFNLAAQLKVVNPYGTESWIVDGGLGDLDGTPNHSIQFQTTADPVFIQIY